MALCVDLLVVFIEAGPMSEYIEDLESFYYQHHCYNC